MKEKTQLERVLELAKVSITLDPWPSYGIPPGAWFWAIHHSVIVEKLSESLLNRVEYILNRKPKHERKIRLDAMRPVKKRQVFSAAWAEHDKVCSAAWVEYNKACSAAWAEHDKVRSAASAEYNKVCSAAGAEYDKVRSAAIAELSTRYAPPLGLGYDKACYAAWLEYDKVRSAAIAEYNKVCSAAWMRNILITPSGTRVDWCSDGLH